jgi:hypothetical protein
MRALFLHLVSAIVGGAVGAVLFAWLFLPTLLHDKEEFGRAQGYAAGQIDVATKIPGVLGADFSKTEKYIPFYSMKDVDVVVVERSGVKTLRVYADQ